MSIIDVYSNNCFDLDKSYAFSIVRVNETVFVGLDSNDNTVLVIESKEQKVDSISQRTKELSFECNKSIVFKEEGMEIEQICHIIRCYSHEKKDRMFFIRLCDTFFFDRDIHIQDIIEFFSIMTEFFSDKKDYSQISLQGLYAELYTIYSYSNILDLVKCWQNQDKYKFDFSINETTKLEIKSTTKSTRIHHFKHEQLAVNILDIYVLSYKFRLDNDGLSLLELINKCLPLFDNYPKKKARLQKIVFDFEGDDSLKNICYLEKYTKENMRFIDGKDIPKFQENTPENISDAEYDSNCENVKPIEADEIIKKFIDLRA